MTTNSHESLTKAVLKFAGHVLSGALTFIVVAVAAFCLGKFVHVLEQNGASPGQIYILTALEYVIFIGDVVLVLFFTWNAVVAAFKEMKK